MGAPLHIGRYLLLGEIASGGMATVHYGRMTADQGFSRLVAIKRLHPQFAKDSSFVAMFLDEARLASRFRHPNIVATSDVVSIDGEALLVMELVHGETLSSLLRSLRKRGEAVPPTIAAGIMVAVLEGLHAAHDAVDESGAPLDVVHRDVSPQNVLVGSDGIPRLVDFGIAKAVGRHQTTQDGSVKGKSAYMAPEQVRAKPLDRRCDVFAAGIVLWEMLTGARLFAAEGHLAIITEVLEKTILPPSVVRPDIPSSLDAVAMKALERDPEARFASAREMAAAIEHSLRPASAREIGGWLAAIAGDSLMEKSRRMREMETTPRTELAAPAPLPTPPADSTALDAATATTHAADTRSAKKRGRPWITVLAAVALVALTVVATVLLVPRANQAPTAAATPSAPPSPGPTEDPSASASDRVVPPLASSHAPVASASTTAGATRTAPPPKPTTKPAPTSSCVPHFVQDDAIHRHWVGCP